MFKIQTLNDISRNGLDRLPAARYSTAKEVDEPDAVLLRSADMHKTPIAASVKAVARAGAGVNNIPVAELSARGVPVFNAPGANANAVKELVVAGMLLAARNIAEALGFVRGLEAGADLHHKVEAEKKRFVGSELAGRTLGVVGLGAIGVKVANAAHALGMHVVGFDPHMTVDGAWQLSSEVAKAGSLNELFAVSDYLTFHVPLNDKTKGVFGAAALEIVRPGIVLLNFCTRRHRRCGGVAQGSRRWPHRSLCVRFSGCRLARRFARDRLAAIWGHRPARRRRTARSWSSTSCATSSSTAMCTTR